MRTSVKLITALSVAGLALAAGSASTASNTFAPDATVPLTGYATTTVSGATVNSLTYDLDEAGAKVESAVLVLAGDTTESDVQMNFNGATSFSCGVGVFVTSTTYTCTPGVEPSTSDLASTGVVVN